MANPAFMWIIIAVVLSIIEAFTMGLTTIWFAGGAVVTAIVSIFTDNIWIQILVFAVSSGVLVCFTRPFLVDKLKVGSEKTNVEAIIGKTGIVTKQIGHLVTGEVNLLGQQWTAISDMDNEIETGTEVSVLRVEGVKLVVVPTKTHVDEKKGD